MKAFLQFIKYGLTRPSPSCLAVDLCHCIDIILHQHLKLALPRYDYPLLVALCNLILDKIMENSTFFENNFGKLSLSCPHSRHSQTRKGIMQLYNDHSKP